MSVALRWNWFYCFFYLLLLNAYADAEMCGHRVVRHDSMHTMCCGSSFETLCCTTPYHTISYHAMPYHAMPCHTTSYHIIPCHAMPDHTITIPYHTMPCHAIVCDMDLAAQFGVRWGRACQLTKSESNTSRLHTTVRTTLWNAREEKKSVANSRRKSAKAQRHRTGMSREGTPWEPWGWWCISFPPCSGSVWYPTHQSTRDISGLWAWHGMAWYGMHGMVWYGMVWCCFLFFLTFQGVGFIFFYLNTFKHHWLQQ